MSIKPSNPDTQLREKPSNTKHKTIIRPSNRSNNNPEEALNSELNPEARLTKHAVISREVQSIIRCSRVFVASNMDPQICAPQYPKEPYKHSPEPNPE